jgi:hypothetical protein
LTEDGLETLLYIGNLTVNYRVMLAGRERPAHCVFLQHVLSYRSKSKVILNLLITFLHIVVHVIFVPQEWWGTEKRPQTAIKPPSAGHILGNFVTQTAPQRDTERIRIILNRNASNLCNIKTV